MAMAFSSETPSPVAVTLKVPAKDACTEQSKVTAISRISPGKKVKGVPGVSRIDAGAVIDTDDATAPVFAMVMFPRKCGHVYGAEPKAWKKLNDLGPAVISLPGRSQKTKAVPWD